MKDLSAKQRGPWLFTLLEGKALEAVEHLEFEDLSKEEGEQALWNALKKRFPEKEPHDQMGEALGEVFGLCAHDGETSQQWTARVQEVFLKCTRKASVSFPAEAQGWIALHCAGFNEEQKAIIKAKAQGKLDIEQISAAMRSCFPAYKASSRARKPMSALVVEQQDDGETSRDDGADDAAEALAVTWKERRKELSQLQRSRKFNAADQARKSFRVEIEELKRRTKCRRCGKTGHWARECRLPPQPGFRSTSSASAMSSARGQGVQNTTEANFVEHQGNPHEVAMVTAEGATQNHEITFVGTAEVTCLQVGQADREAPGLVSSPGFGVIDSGCGRTLIGEDTLKILTEKLAQITRRPVETYETTNVFRFGNGATETSSIAVRLPVGIGGQVGLIDAAIIRGQAPLLLGRPTLEKLRVKLNFKDHTMHVLDQKEPVPMDTNRAGQLLVDVMNFPANDRPSTAVVELFSPPRFTAEAPVREEQAPDPRTMQALKKLHANLGHPSTKELVRVLRHSGASEEAVRLAGQLQCSVCANNQRPSPPPPANASVAKEFNEQVGLDIKYLPSWEPTKKIPCVNIVDYATSLQIMIPLPKVETGDLIVAALRDRWIAWAGPPQRLVLDPSQPNLSEVLGAFCNNAGVDMRHTAAEAAWQIGKVERHGQWFERIFKRVCDECHPASDAEFQMCLQQTQSAKNSLLTETGASPYQLVFGRNPRVPTDLMQEQPHLPAVDAAEFESVWSRSNAVRMSARKAVLEVHDDRALKAALRARPRVTRPFRSGEAVVAEFPDSELLGIRTLLEKGQFPKSQFLDLTQEGRPPEPEAASPEESSPTALNAAEFLRNSRQQERPPRPVPIEPVSAPTSAS
ncbi:GIP, partial [Symbiodinium pilosum]